MFIPSAIHSSYLLDILKKQLAIDPCLPFLSTFRYLLLYLTKRERKAKTSQVLNPSRLLTAIGKHDDQFDNRRQQDAHELLVSCLNLLEWELGSFLMDRHRSAKENSGNSGQDEEGNHSDEYVGSDPYVSISFLVVSFRVDLNSSPLR